MIPCQEELVPGLWGNAPHLKGAGRAPAWADKSRAGEQWEALCNGSTGTFCERMNNGPPSLFLGLVVRGTYWLTV